MTLDGRKYDVSENLNYYRSNRIELLYARKFADPKLLEGLMHENLAARKYLSLEYSITHLE